MSNATTNATVPVLTAEEKAAEARIARENILPEKVAKLESANYAGRPASVTSEIEKISWAIRYGSDHLVRSLAAGHASGHTYFAERRSRELPAAKIATDTDVEDRVSPSEAALDVAAAYRRLGYDASVSWVTDDRGSREAVTIDVPWCQSWLIVELTKT
jgi:hypothetical protein